MENNARYLNYLEKTKKGKGDWWEYTGESYFYRSGKGYLFTGKIQ